MYKGTIAIDPTPEALVILREAGVIVKSPSITIDIEVESLDALDEYWGRFIWSLEQYIGKDTTRDTGTTEIIEFPTRHH